MNKFEQEIHDGYLFDIAFEMNQTGEFLILLRKNPFDKFYKQIINEMRANKQRLIDEYTNRYGKTPNIQDAKRIFLENKGAAYFPWGEARVVNHNNSVA